MHYFKDFKCFEDAKLDLMRPVTLMIGKNGAGKSNAIEGVELLAQLANGRPLHEIVEVGRGNGTSFELRGSLNGCARGAAPHSNPQRIQDILQVKRVPFTLGFQAAIAFRGENWPLDYNITIETGIQPKVKEEILTIGSWEFYKGTLENNSDLLEVRMNNFASGGNKPFVQAPADRSILSRYVSLASAAIKAEDKRKEALNVVGRVDGYLSSAFVFDPSPRAMRAYERIGQRELSKDGANLSSVLHSLGTGTEDSKAALSRILERLRHLPEEPFKSFEFITTQLNDVIFALRQENDDLVDARILSDGTLRSLAILTALETTRKGSRLVIEEMDNGLHPSRVKILVDAIWETATKRDLNILATTHNPATLDSLNESQLGSVVLCFYDSQLRASRLMELKDLPRSDVLLERGHLGDLVTRQVIEQHLKPEYEKQQRGEALEWVKSLK